MKKHRKKEKLKMNITATGKGAKKFVGGQYVLGSKIKTKEKRERKPRWIYYPKTQKYVIEATRPWITLNIEGLLAGSVYRTTTVYVNSEREEMAKEAVENLKSGLTIPQTVQKLYKKCEKYGCGLYFSASGSDEETIKRLYGLKQTKKPRALG